VPELLRSATQFAGSCGVSLELDRGTARSGEYLAGRILITGGDADQLLGQVSVGLLVQGVEGNWTKHSTKSWEELRIAQRERRVVEFSLVVPEVVTASEQGEVLLSVSYQEEYRFVVGLEVQLSLADCYHQLADCLSRIARVPVTEWISAGRGDGIAARLVPTGPARELFDELRLEIYRTGLALYGELVIDPRERTLADRLKAKVGADRRRFPFRFRSADTEEVSAFFEQCLRPYQHAVARLPIPAACPAPAAPSLPRPASCSSGNPALADES
jgi:hypothetical protein